MMDERPGKGIRVADSCDLKLVKLSAVRTNEVKLFQMAGAQHENQRAAMFLMKTVLTVSLT